LGGESIGIYTVDQRGVIRNTATGLIEVHGGTGLNADAFGGGATGYFGDITTNSPNFYNDGIIRAYAADGFGGGDSYGIVTGGQISGSGGATNLGILSNTGRITATGGNATGTGEYSEGGEAYGVYIDTANAFTNTGSGIIEATGGSGVEGAGGAAESVLFTASVANATNAGQITAVGGSSVDGDGAYGYGMDVSETLSVFDNTGTISGTGGASDSGGGGEGGGSMLTSCRM